MTDRTVAVTLTANVANYVRGMNDGTEATRRSQSAMKELAGTAGPVFIGIGAAAAGFVGLAISKFAEFDQAMSEVQASTHESASNMGLLRDAAVKAGADTVFSAKEAADAENELAKAGVSTADILGGALSGAMSLASAGGLGVADAAELAATAMTQFKLSGSDVPHIADLLAAGAGKAQGSVEDLGQALSQGGLVASQAGQSIEETTGTLAAFASAGLVGSDAGTSLKTMLLALENPSTKASSVMSEYGINIYGAQGKMLGFSGIADQLKTKLGGLTDEQRNTALATIFGSDAVRAASVLYDQGAAGIEDWTDKVNDSGFAAEMARIKLDNLNGDLEYLKGSIDTALIQTGSNANGVLRDLVQWLTSVVDTVGNLPGPVLGAGLVLAGLVAAVGLLGGAFISLIPKIAATKAVMADLNLTGKTIVGGFGKGGGVLLAVTALISGFAGLGAQGQLTSDQLASVTASMDKMKLKNIDTLFPKSGASIDATTGALASLKEVTGGFWDESRSGFTKWLDGASFGLSHLSDVYKTNEATFKQIGSSFAELAKTDFASASDQFAGLIGQLSGGDDTAKRLLETMPEYKASLIELAGAQGVVLDDQGLLNLAQGKGETATALLKEATKKQSDALVNLSGAANNAKIDIGELADAIKNFGKAQFDTDSAARSFEAAVDDLSAAVEKNGQTLDITTDAGRSNQEALESIASSTLNLASATETQTGNQDEAAAAISRGRDAFIAAGIQAGLSAEAAGAYADKLGLIPSNVLAAIQLQTTAADQAVNDFIARNSQKRVNIAVQTSGGGYGGSGGETKYADGGQVSGPGSGTSDSIPAYLSNGEHVWTARETRAAGGHGAVESLRRAALRGYANGGAVASNYLYAPPNYKTAALMGGSRVERNLTQNFNGTDGPSAAVIGNIAVNAWNHKARSIS